MYPLILTCVKSQREELHYDSIALTPSHIAIGSSLLAKGQTEPGRDCLLVQRGQVYSGTIERLLCLSCTVEEILRASVRHKYVGTSVPKPLVRSTNINNTLPFLGIEGYSHPRWDIWSTNMPEINKITKARSECGNHPAGLWMVICKVVPMVSTDNADLDDDALISVSMGVPRNSVGLEGSYHK